MTWEEIIKESKIHCKNEDQQIGYLAAMACRLLKEKENLEKSLAVTQSDTAIKFSSLIQEIENWIVDSDLTPTEREYFGIIKSAIAEEVVANLIDKIPEAIQAVVDEHITGVDIEHELNRINRPMVPRQFP